MVSSLIILTFFPQNLSVVYPICTSTYLSNGVLVNVVSSHTGAVVALHVTVSNVEHDENAFIPIDVTVDGI